MTGPLRLYEAVLWEPGSGYFLLDRHMERLARSAAHFGFVLDVAAIRRALEQLAPGRFVEPRKVRLELHADGKLHLGDEAVRPSTPVRVCLASSPVDARDEFLRHKTSRREVYDAALAAHPEVSDVVLWNERGQLTETCHANLVLQIGGRRWTPECSAGLLPGTFRAHLLALEEIEEATLGIDDLERAEASFLINSVRRWCELDWVAR